MESPHRPDRPRRGNRRPAAPGRPGIFAAALVAILLLSGGAGIGDSYSGQDIRRDALRLVPPTASDVKLVVMKGDGFNPTLTARVSFTLLHLSEKQRIAEYIARARAYGWNVHGNRIENGHADLIVVANFGVPDGSDELVLVKQ